ncbi:DMT family transporter [Catalinimonas niigatensis]|uniref:DMT family transporter n=1 Tax=Catalinimonas niigatensis TaxID=1397264 RepID=UPI0026658ABE|nr:DMT family transporter [Catalinimonas niigatensis]WPP49173.1 DMT family transporter [Catalinimonas niigatensis]
MKIYLFALMLLIGVVLALHLTMNAQVGVILKNPKMGNALFWTIGGITAILIGLSSWEGAVFSRLSEVPIWLLTAGAMGAALVFGIAWTIPQIGAGPAFVLMIAGQVIAGLLFSHFGVLGSPVEPISLMKIFGALLLIGGVGIVTFAR